jgi:hypothetical protein
VTARPHVRNAERLVAKLRDRAAKARRESAGSVVVGYTAQYAIFIHENMEQRRKGEPRSSGRGVYWGPNGQPKFLEGPARELSPILGNIVATAVAAGKTLIQGLLLAGLRLQRESQQRVPVDTGFLRASAFTRIES